METILVWELWDKLDETALPATLMPKWLKIAGFRRLIVSGREVVPAGSCLSAWRLEGIYPSVSVSRVTRQHKEVTIQYYTTSSNAFRQHILEMMIISSSKHRCKEWVNTSMGDLSHTQKGDRSVLKKYAESEVMLWNQLLALATSIEPTLVPLLLRAREGGMMVRRRKSGLNMGALYITMSPKLGADYSKWDVLNCGPGWEMYQKVQAASKALWDRKYAS